MVADGPAGIRDAVCGALESEGAIPVVLTGLTDATSCRRAVQGVFIQYGRIDGLVGQVGLAGNLETGTSHNYVLSQTAMNQLKAVAGSVVNIISEAADIVGANHDAYEKVGGLRFGMTAAWAAELRHCGIRVNCLVVSEKPPAETIADTVLFLLSEKSSGINAVHLYVDGGKTILNRKRNLMDGIEL